MVNNIVPGKKTPSLVLSTLDNDTWSLEANTNKTKIMIVFYRGLHCPVCSEFLKLIDDQVSEYKKSNTDLSSEIDRLKKYVKTMETISKKHDLDVKNDFVKIHNLIQELRNQTNDQNVINNDLIGQIKIILDSVKNKISESSSKHQSNFIKQFLEKLLDKIEKQLTNVQGDNIDQTQIDKGHELILEIRDLLSKNQINSAKIVYSELKELMKNIGN